MPTIRVKRGTTTPTTSNLTYVGELAFDYSSDSLYVRGSSSVVKIGGDMELVYKYEGYASTHAFKYPFDPIYIYKVHVIAGTLGTSADTSDTYMNYRTTSLGSLSGSYLSHYVNTENATHDKSSGKNVTNFYVKDGYVTGPVISSGVTKVIDFEISPTFKTSAADVQQWMAYGKSMTSLSGQGDTSIIMTEFVHSFNGSFGYIYVNPGLNLGAPDSISLSLYRIRRK